MSMLCARQGASRVIAVEAAPETAQLARRIIQSNHFDNIDIKSSKVEALDEHELQDVDVIVSEWMGYSLLYEAMLESVLWARDRYTIGTSTLENIHIHTHTHTHESQTFPPSLYPGWT